MEHLCHRCGAQVTEGALFCPQCGAPQIRVSIPGSASATLPMPPGTPDEIQPPAQTVPVAPGIREGVDWRAARSSIAAAGVFAGFAAMVVPLGGIGALLWTFLATLLVVRLYSRRPAVRLDWAHGARLGAATGLASFVTWALLFVVAIVGFRQGPQLRDYVLKSMQEAATRYPAPQSAQVLEFISSPSGFAFFVTLSVGIFLVFSIACGLLGGAMAGALFGKPRR